MYYTTQGIILSYEIQGERGRVYEILTEKRGLVRAQAKGTNVMASKLGSELTMYRILYLSIVSKRIDRIIGVETEEIYQQLWQDAKRQGYAAWACAVLSGCMKPGVSDVRIFQLVKDYFIVLNNSDTEIGQLPLMRLAFITKLIGLLGYRLPDITDEEKSNIEQLINAKELISSISALAPIQRIVHERAEGVLNEIGDDRIRQVSKYLLSF